MKRLISVTAALLIAAGLYASSRYNYLFFHTLAEGFSILVACGIFMVAWNCRRYLDNHYFLFIGIAYLFIGVLAVFHAFVYRGMNLMPGYDANAPTQLWIAARYVESLSLLVAPLMLRRRVRPGLVFGGFGLVALFLLFSILSWRIFPDCFLENAGGLTPFKKISEYIISLIFMASGLIIVHFRKNFDSHVLRWLLLSIAFSVVSELSFTTYASVYGFSNLLGHYFQIVSFYFIYKAVIETGLAKPYDLLFRDLDRQREWLRVTLGSIGDAVIAVDLTGRVTFMNSVASALTAWEPQAALGQPVGNVLQTINEQSRETAKDIAACVLEQGCVMEMASHTTLVSRDRREIPIEDSAAPIKDTAGHIIGVVIVFRDVTEKRQAHTELQESEKRFRSVVESNMIGVVFADPVSGTITDANDEFLRIVGRSRQELLAGTVNWKKMTPPEVLAKEIHLADSHPTDALVPGFEKEYVRPDGTCVPVIVGGSFLDDTRTRVAAYVLDNTERKQAEEALRRSESTYRAIAHNFPNGAVYLIDREMRIHVADGQGLSLIGLSREALEGKTVSQHPLHAALEPHLQRVFDGASFSETEFEYQNRIRHSHFVPIRDAQGGIIFVMIVTQDVTEKRTIDQKLRQSELLYREVVQNANSVIIRWKSDGAILFFNEYAQEFFGYKAEEVIGKDVGLLMPAIGSSGAGLKDLVRDIVDHPQRYTHNISENICRDGRRAWMNWTNKPIYGEDGSVAEILAVGSDITQTKKVEEALRHSIEKFELLSNTAARLLAAEDPQNLVQELCCEVMAFLDCQAFFNFLVDERTGKLRLNAYSGIPPSEARQIEWLDFGSAVCGCVARDRQRIIAEDILNTPDIRTELVKAYGIQAYCCHPLHIQDRLIGTLSFGTKKRPHFTSEEVELMRTMADNVALAMQRIQVQKTLQNVNKELERKVLERSEELVRNYEQLSRANAQLQARANQLRRLTSELTMAEQRERKRLSKILHDGLQQHLAAAKMQLGYFADKFWDPDRKQQAYGIEAILGESIQMSRSLSVELSPPVLQEAGLAGGLEWLARWMRDKHNFNVELSIEVRPELTEDVTVLVFESLRELLFNAVKHAKVSWARVNLGQNGNSETRIIVGDEGVGFDPSRLNSESATAGLGLFSIRERIDSIGGRFEIDSAPGKGCRFTLIVPGAVEHASALADQPVAEPDALPGSDHRGANIRVVLADDHALFRDGIGRMLNQEPDIEVVGYARDGLQAIELARKLMPNMILMDIGMPGVDGIEATRVICSESSTIRVVGLSMYEDEERSQAMLAAGAVAYKSKGCALTELISVIRACIK